MTNTHLEDPHAGYLTILLMCILMSGCDANESRHQSCRPAATNTTYVNAEHHDRHLSAAYTNVAPHEQLTARAANPDALEKEYARMLVSIMEVSATDADALGEDVRNALASSNAVWLSQCALNLLDQDQTELALLYAATAIKIAGTNDLTRVMGQRFGVVFNAILAELTATQNGGQAEEDQNIVNLVDALVAHIECSLGANPSENMIMCYIELCAARNNAVLTLKKDIDAALAYLDHVHAAMDSHGVSRDWKNEMLNHVLYDTAWDATRSTHVYTVTPATLYRLKQYAQQMQDTVVRPGWEEPIAKGYIIEEPYLKPFLIKAIKRIERVNEAKL